MSRRTLLTFLAIVVIAVAPLILLRNSDTEFGGADGQAADEVSRIDPDHEPWFSPIWSPPGGETESLLFALQAALGAGVIGYVFGAIRTKHRLTMTGSSTAAGPDGAERVTPSTTG